MEDVVGLMKSQLPSVQGTEWPLVEVLRNYYHLEGYCAISKSLTSISDLLGLCFQKKIDTLLRQIRDTLEIIIHINIIETD